MIRLENVKVNSEQIIINDENQKLIKAFLNYLKMKGCSINTISGYDADLQAFFKQVNINALQINFKDINPYFLNLMGEGKAPRTINRKMAAIKCFYKFLIKNKHIKDNPTLKLEGSKLSRKLPEYLTDEQVNQLIDSIECLRNKCIVALLYSSGMRLSEMYILNKNNINWNKKEIKVFGKGAKERIVPFNNKAKQLLLEYLQSRSDECEALFISNQKKRLGKRFIQKMLKEYGEKIGINGIHPHLFRHSIASRLCQNDVPIQEIQEILGHADIGTTTIYSHLNNTKVRNSYNRVFED